MNALHYFVFFRISISIFPVLSVVLAVFRHLFTGVISSRDEFFLASGCLLLGGGLHTRACKYNLSALETYLSVKG